MTQDFFAKVEKERAFDVLQFFAYAHLPPRLHDVSKVFCDTANALSSMTAHQIQREIDQRKAYQAANVFSALCGIVDNELPANTEATWAVIKINEAADLLVALEPMDRVLRRLLEAKDCAVRAVLYRRVG